ncbi:MAG: hypothetical protein ACOC7J_06185 [Armatimonadota bacterium]
MAVEMDEDRDQGAMPHPNLYGPPVRQFDAMPRWLRWSGLSQVIGPTAWALYMALIMVDHQTMGLPRRRHGRKGMAFEVGYDALERLTGYQERAIANRVQELRAKALLDHYWEGRSGYMSRFRVCRAFLRELYRYVGPILEPEHQGIRGVALRENLDGGLIIYGYHDQLPLMAQWEDLWKWQKASLDQHLPETPETGHVRSIVENFVEKQVESNAT